ncbi:sterol desaturase family protein [Burkholderia sp. AU15512]|uniref:sterol desaturase family protein n=1 Tax=Burkholderia sp. AU15512 TaxID=2015345 RepID=UPI000B7A9162|nr:sterol desaturase family protein [Burkholderia sp. AU15512]OXI19062.1 sterol desaturase [Burkholderia sp. AU15512]
MPTELMTWLHAFLGNDVDWKQVLLIGMTPVFLIAFAIEYAVMTGRGRREPFRWKEIVANLSLGAGYQVAETVMGLLFTGAIFAWAYRHRLFDVPVNGFTIVPIFVVVEFCYYWFHRTSHRVRWFWAAHVPHHSGEVMNFTTAMRQSLLNAFVGVFVFYLPPVWLGIPPAVVLFLLAVDLAYQYFVHTEAIGRLPRGFEYVFDTPSNHRAHHGRNPRYIDRNYGGVLIIFDRLFGTYVEETEPVDYGITQQIRSTNFLVLNLHEFVDMWRDVLAPGPVLQRLKHLWMPPEWERPGHRPIHTWSIERKGEEEEATTSRAMPDEDASAPGRKIVQATGTRSG